MRNLFVLQALMIHSPLNAAVSWWLIPAQIITQGDFCLLVHAAAHDLFWGHCCEERKEEVKCEQNVAWLL